MGTNFFMNVGYCFCVTYVQQLHLKSVITAVGKASHTCGFVHFATGIHSKLVEDERRRERSSFRSFYIFHFIADFDLAGL